MEACKGWIRRNAEGVRVWITLAKGWTCLLPNRSTKMEIGLEAVGSIFDIMKAVNTHIIEMSSSKMHRRPPKSSSFPYLLCLNLLKDTEALVEVVAHHYCGDNNKWNFIAVMEATKVLARLALLRNNGYKMLLHRKETMNDREDPNNANQQHETERFLQQGQNGTSVKRLTLSSILSEKGLHGGLFLMGEFMFIARPLVYVLLLREYGLRSWLPWLVSLSIDLVAMSSSTVKLTNHKDQRLSISDPEKHELERRKGLLVLYLLRDPLFGKYLRQMLKIANKTLRRVPSTPAAHMVSFLVGLLLGVQRRYTYISGA